MSEEADKKSQPEHSSSITEPERRLSYGNRKRMPSSAKARFQAGERTSASETKNDGLDLLERMASMEISANDMQNWKHDHLLMGFITDENTGAGFGLAGLLELGTPIHHSAASHRKTERATITVKKLNNPNPLRMKTKRKVKKHHPEFRNKNFFIVRSKTSQQELENAFESFSKRDDIAILAINSDIMIKLSVPIAQHEEQGQFPIIVPIPLDDNPDRAFQDPGLRRPSALGYLPTTNRQKLFQEVEKEFQQDKFHFHTGNRGSEQQHMHPHDAKRAHRF